MLLMLRSCNQGKDLVWSVQPWSHNDPIHDWYHIDEDPTRPLLVKTTRALADTKHAAMAVSHKYNAVILFNGSGERPCFNLYRFRPDDLQKHSESAKKVTNPERTALAFCGNRLLILTNEVRFRCSNSN